MRAHTETESYLADYDWLFVQWGRDFPRGYQGKGDNRFDADIAQDARIAFAKGFIPHCEIGADDCQGKVEFRRVIKDGKLTIQRSTTPSCKRSLTYGLQSGKYAAMQAADRYYRRDKYQDQFADVLGDPGALDRLECEGHRLADVANGLGIYSQWIDDSRDCLADVANADIGHYLKSHGIDRYEDVLPSKLGQALRRMNPAMIDAVARLADGMTQETVALSLGITQQSLDVRLKQAARFGLQQGRCSSLF